MRVLRHPFRALRIEHQLYYLRRMPPRPPLVYLPLLARGVYQLPPRPRVLAVIFRSSPADCCRRTRRGVNFHRNELFVFVFATRNIILIQPMFEPEVHSMVSPTGTLPSGYERGMESPSADVNCLEFRHTSRVALGAGLKATESLSHGPSNA